MAGVTRPTATKAYNTGWPRFAWGRPIKLILEDERETVRAEAQKAAEGRRMVEQQARTDRRDATIKAFKEEGVIIDAMRQNVHIAVVQIRTVLRVAGSLQKQLVEDVETKGALKGLTPLSKMTLITGAARAAQSLTSACTAVIEWDRKHYGDPSEAIEQTAAETQMTPEEVAQELLALKQSLALLDPIDPNVTADEAAPINEGHPGAGTIQ